MGEIKENPILVGSKEKNPTKEKFLMANLRPGTNLYSSDPDKDNYYTTGVIPEKSVVRVVFNFMNKGSNFANCKVKEIKDLLHGEKRKLDVGLNIPWEIYPGDRAYVNKVLLGNKMMALKRRTSFEQPSLSGFPKIPRAK